jgi:hypothetical protein
MWLGLLSGVSCIMSDAIRVPQAQKLHTQAMHTLMLWTCVVVSATSVSAATDYEAKLFGLGAGNIFFGTHTYTTYTHARTPHTHMHARTHTHTHTHTHTGRILTLAIYYTRYSTGILRYMRKHDYRRAQMCMVLSRPLLRRDRTILLGSTLTLR